MSERRLSADLPSRIRQDEGGRAGPRAPVQLRVIGPQPDCSQCIGLCCGKAISKIYLYPEQFQTDVWVVEQGRWYEDETEQKFLAYKGDGSCVYLSKENRCTIYEQRPEVCRQFNCLRSTIADGLVESGELKRYQVVNTPPHEFMLSHPPVAAKYTRWRMQLARLKVQLARMGLLQEREVVMKLRNQ
jgi:hypothetical protein